MNLNFKKELRAGIETGKKTGTLRKFSGFYNDAKIGTKLYLFTGLKSKKANRIITPYNEKNMLESDNNIIVDTLPYCKLTKKTYYRFNLIPANIDKFEAIRQYYHKENKYSPFIIPENIKAIKLVIEKRNEAGKYIEINAKELKHLLKVENNKSENDLKETICKIYPELFETHLYLILLEWK